MNFKDYDMIVVGSGFAGATVAQICAANKGENVLVIEKRGHVAGNCYDEYDKHGIMIHKYGPHIFHTNSKEVHDYLSNFTQWYDYSHEVVAKVGDEYLPVPFNLNTLREVYGEKKSEELRGKLIEKYGYATKVPILELRKSDDPEICAIAEFVYENIFLKYTMKQWGQKPEEIDPAVTGRVPVLISDDNRYFQDLYQGMPLEGYTKLVENMLKNETITTVLNTDVKDIMMLKDGKVLINWSRISLENVLEGAATLDLDGATDEYVPFEGQFIFTGPTDELLDLKYGRLPYRTLRFDFEYIDEPEYQPRAVVNYTVSEDFTRITEFKKLTGQDTPGTTIMREYPMSYEAKDGQIPYYAIMNEKNNANYRQYADEIAKYPNVFLLGRLAEYKYYNIDAIVLKAMELAETL